MSGGTIIGGVSPGCASVVRDSAGNYTVTFTNAQADAEYIVTMGINRIASGASVGIINYHSPTTGGFQIKCETSGGVALDPVSFSFVASS